MNKKRYPQYFTVGDLKKFLECLPENLPVGVRGHYGEFLMMDKDQFGYGKARLIPGNGWNWMKADDVESAVFLLEPPNRGPDPD